MYYVENVIKYSLILIIVMSLKVILNINITNIDSPNLSYYKTSVLNIDKPVFTNTNLNNIVDNYIKSNNCSKLNYNIYKIDSSYINIFLNCGKPENYIYNASNNTYISIVDLMKDSTKFINKVHDLLKLKYPEYVSNSINVLDGKFDIKSNEIIAYYDNDISIKINNNEIKDLMTYRMKYDKTYKNEVYKLDKNKKTIAFTFDDGPSIYDEEITDTLTKNHATATFFIVGNRIDTYNKTIKYMLKNNMEIGNHTFDHKALFKLNDDEILNEINNTKTLFKEKYKKDMTLFRPSYGAVNKEVLTKANVPSILWSVDTLDWKYRDKDKVYNEIMKNTKDGSIILMHSLYQSTLDAIKMALPELEKEGYQVVSVSKLMELKGKTITPGNVYFSGN